MADGAPSLVSFFDTLRQLALLKAEQFNEISLQRDCPDSPALAKELIRRGWLTPYQVNQLLQHKGSELLVGPYVLVERLGAGGAGQVFKAYHQKMNRVAAVKVIRPDLLSDADMVSRFYREIEAVSKLVHPNIIHAYDAGPIAAATPAE